MSKLAQVNVFSICACVCCGREDPTRLARNTVYAYAYTYIKTYLTCISLFIVKLDRIEGP